MTLLSKPNFSINDLAIRVLAGLLISAASLYAPIINAAPIYKVIDKQTGQVTFTDNPQNYEQQAGKLISQTGITTGNSSSSSNNNSNNASGSSALNPQAIVTLPEMAKTVPVNYQLAITEPSDEQVYYRLVQDILINAQLQPALQRGDSVSIYLNDNKVARGLTASIATADVLPGQHNIQVVVKNDLGQPVQQTSRSIYVVQNSPKLQKDRAIAQQLLAYQQLPWYQKVLLKLRQDDSKKQQAGPQ